jgi:signal transduction histidine kinase
MSDAADEVRKLLRQQEAIAAFGSFALRENDLAKILTEAARVCAHGLDVRFAKVCRYRADENDLFIEAGHGWQSGVVGCVVSRADTTSPQGRAFMTGQPSICNDLTKDSTFQLPSFYAAHGIISTVDVLIKGDDKPYGVLEIDNDAQHDYNEHDINFLTGFANVLAEAVGTAARIETLHANVEQMKALVDEKNDLLDQKQVLTEELREFAHVASHDLKAPLRAISLLAGWIEQDVQGSGSAGPETLDNLRLMRERADRLKMLLEGLLAYACVGQADAPAETVDIGALVGEIANSLGPPPGFVIRFDGEAPVISTPRPPLEHVLQNLISNAVKHHDRPTGEVVISALDVDGMTEIRVADDGPGIAPESQTRVFEIFATLVGADAREASGVGLSIVKKAVERVGGTVRIDSTPSRRGATFIFTWPTASYQPP